MQASSRIANHMTTLLDAIERNIAALAHISVDLRASDAALNAISEGVLVTDEKGALLSVNDAFSRITGYDRVEMVGQTCAFLQGERTDPAEVEKIRLARFHGTGYSGELLNYRKDGSTFWNDLTISPVMDVGGTVRRYIGIARDVTERRRSQKELRIAAVAFQSREGIMITDANQVILRVNRAFTEITGYEECEAIGRTPRLLSSGRQGAAFYEELERTLRQTGTWQGEIWNRRKDGAEYLEWLIITAVREDHGEISHYVGAFTDITARKGLEQKLHHKQRRLSEAQRIGKMGSWELHHEDGRLDWSDELYRIFEIEKASFPANYQAFLNTVHPEDRIEVDRVYQDSVLTRKPYSIVHRLMMADGRTKFIHEQGETIYDQHGKPVRSAGTAQDISERKQAEQELHISAIAFESHQGIIIGDSERVIVRVNRAFTEITGFEANEAIGHKPSHLFGAPRHGQEYFAAITESIDGCGYWQGEVWNRRKDGSDYPIWLHVTAVKSSGGKITHHVSTFMDITERKQAEEKIHQLAFYDALTRLPNRQSVLDAIRAVAEQSRRRNEFGALLYIDLDDFKTINDTLGHEIGDLLLQEMAQRIAAAIGASDVVARVGGDEFGVVLRALGNRQLNAQSNAERVAREILTSLGRPCTIANYSCQCSASIGVTLIGTEGADSVESILKRADMAMFHAKSDGRNGIRFFQDEMHARVHARATLESELRAALANGRFELYYQPQVDHAGAVVGAEALIRLQHPEKGVIAPGDFVGLAEDIGLMVPIGDWVIETACAQIVRWSRDDRTAHLSIAVNVSSQQFRNGELVDKVKCALVRTGANPERLKLELTETLLLTDVDATIDQMRALNQLGVTFCLDDFGTGYSSLAYLRRLPIHHLKIDKSFVQDIPDAGACEFVRTILALARNQGLFVIAEGVETEAQRDFLRQEGCDFYQGYHFGRPLPLEHFLSHIAQASDRR